MEYYSSGKLVWAAPGDILSHFRQDQVIWLLGFWHDLELGMWPPMPVEQISDRYRSRHAYFEVPIQIKLELETRIRRCGRDGQMLMDKYMVGKSDKDMELTYRDRDIRDIEDIEYRVSKALEYVAGSRRKRSRYVEWRWHMRSEELVGAVA